MQAGIKRSHPFTGVVIFCILQHIRACDLIINLVSWIEVSF